MHPLLIASCIIPPLLLSIAQPGDYTLCPGAYRTHVSIQSDDVTLTCLSTRIIGDGTYETGVWTQGIQICNGERTFENITIQGCTIENAIVGISGAEVEDEGMHNTLPTQGNLVLRNNQFRTRFSVFTCALQPGAVTLERNRGSMAIILGDAKVHQIQDKLSVYRYDLTGYPNPGCTS